MLDLSNLKNDIKTEAQRLGFTHIGIAPAVPVPHDEIFYQWVGAGYHGSMAYLARPDTLAKRADPGLILDGCQKVISLAIPYQPPESPLNETPPGHGRIAAYALTRDYHHIIWEKLSQLEDYVQIQSTGIAQVKSYVDTGPIIERAFAAFSGIGIPGKNTCLIVPGGGSYVFLAEVLINLELPVDPPFTRDLCGSCQRCIEACPTGCILPDRTIDATRCISYLTIENKGIIPDALKSQIGDWFFGCDVCQMVCPHNARSHLQPNLLGEPLLPECIDLVELLTWDQASFSHTFKNTALSRAQRRGLLRNAAIVLGNQRFAQALPQLKYLLANEDDPIIQDACYWAVGQIEGHNG